MNLDIFSHFSIVAPPGTLTLTGIRVLQNGIICKKVVVLATYFVLKKKKRKRKYVSWIKCEEQREWRGVLGYRSREMEGHLLEKYFLLRCIDDAFALSFQ